MQHYHHKLMLTNFFISDKVNELYEIQKMDNASQSGPKLNRLKGFVNSTMKQLILRTVKHTVC